MDNMTAAKELRQIADYLEGQGKSSLDQEKIAKVREDLIKARKDLNEIRDYRLLLVPTFLVELGETILEKDISREEIVSAILALIKKYLEF